MRYDASSHASYLWLIDWYRSVWHWSDNDVRVERERERERDESKIVEGNMHALDFRMVGSDNEILAIRRAPDKRMLGSEEPCWIGRVACKTCMTCKKIMPRSATWHTSSWKWTGDPSSLIFSSQLTHFSTIQYIYMQAGSMSWVLISVNIYIYTLLYL
jgi:hypothetical protein